MATGGGPQELTDRMLLELARRIPNIGTYRDLAVRGFRMRPDSVQSNMLKNRDLTDAAYRLLYKWRLSEVDSRVAYVRLCEALRKADMGFYITEVLDGPPEDDTVNLPEELKKAYVEACKNGTKHVFNARIILAGYSGAGKTSVATRLLGEKINVDERHSTEGIALHRIESTFNREENTAAKWDKKDLNADNLKKEFGQGLVAILQKGTKIISSASTAAEENPETQEDYRQFEQEIKDVKAPSVLKEEIIGQSEQENQILKTPLLPKKKRPAQKDTEFTSMLDQKKRKEIITLVNIPLKQESEKSTPFSISLWDLGGQDEFISTHHLFIDVEATVLIVMDITKGLYELIGSSFQFGYLNSAVDVLHYWLNLFHTEWEERKKKENAMELNIALVLTHKDQLPEKNQHQHIEDYKAQILEAVKDKPYAKYLTREEIYVVDNTEQTEENFEKLRVQFQKYLEKQKSWGKKIPLPWLSLKADMIEQATMKHIDLEEVWSLAEQYDMNPKEVESFLQMQTTLGDFVFFQDFREVVITDPKWLVDKCKALISTHDFISKRDKLSTKIQENLKRGQVTEDDLKVIWINDKVIYLIKLMEKFDLLVDISDESGHKYIIPCMLRSKYTKINQYDIPYKLLIGSFPQLVAKCSKVNNWKLRQDNLSYTTASFDIGKGIKLHLSLSVSGQVQTSIDWSEEIIPSEREVFQEEVTMILSRILKTCRNQTNPDEAEKKLTDTMVWNLATKFTTKQQVMTFAVTGLKIKTSEVATCLYNHRNDDINSAMQEVLIKWNNSQGNKRTAYRILCKALEAVNMSALINEALDAN